MKIMISAYLDNNFGDDLMIKLLANYFINHEFYVYSDKSIIRNSFDDCKNIIIKNTNEIKNNISEMDLFLSIGGSIFNDLNSIKGKISRLRRIGFIRSLKRKKLKIATIGCNLGPYNDNLGLYLTKKELEMNDLVTVRDKESFEILNAFRTIKNFHVANDIVYNYKIKKNISKSCGLGISVYRSLKHNENNYVNYLTLAKIADEYINKTGNLVRLFAFDSENENDLSAAHHVLNFSKQKNKIELVPYLGDVENFISKLGECERFIAVRFHSAVLSDLLSIPFFPIIYSNKMEALLKDRNYAGDFLQLNELNEKLKVVDLVEKIIEGKVMFNSFDKYSDNSAKHFEELSKLLG